MPRKFSKELVEFVRSNATGKTNREMTDEVNARFGAGTATLEQIKALKSRNHISSGLTGQFRKGHKTWNKGMKPSDWLTPEQIERNKANYFHGDPHNTRPIGSTRISKDGYIEIKVRHVRKNAKQNWVGLHRYVWEQCNGEIPEGMIVSFKDGDRTNCDIDNLILIDRRTAQVMMKHKLWSKHADLTEAGVSVAKVLAKVQERKAGG